MRVGIFGGTFDPPHMGHLILASEAYEQLQLDQLLWVLTPDPPHKRNQPISPAAQRLELIQAAISDNPVFTLSTVDLDRPGPHYAVDTVRLLLVQFPGAELFYLIGGDSLRDLPEWSHPQQLVGEVDGFGVMRRPGDEINLQALADILPGLAQKVHFFSAPLLEISSTEIRTRVAGCKTFRYYLPKPVFELVVLKGYYQEPGS